MTEVLESKAHTQSALLGAKTVRPVAGSKAAPRNLFVEAGLKPQ